MSEGANTIRRKFRTKSRRGCQSCKARKVKCDELHPACRNCIRRGDKCDFLHQVTTPKSIDTPVSLDLELLHHWTISTSSTLSSDARARELWRVLIPQIGFSTRYILDGMFALSALHISRYNAKRRDELVAQATQYHTASLAGALPFISTITSENCGNMFLFSVFTLFFTLARPKQEDDILVVGNGMMPEWLYLLRGTGAVIHAEESTIHASPVYLIFRPSAEAYDLMKNPPTGDRAGIPILEAGILEFTANDEKKRKLLMEAIDGLKRSYTFLSHKVSSDTDRLIGFIDWLFCLSDDYFKLLRVGDQEALCVLAYFSVIIKQLERYWWAEGWAVHLIRRIYMVLDDEHRITIRWAIEEVGWVPESG